MTKDEKEYLSLIIAPIFLKYVGGMSGYESMVCGFLFVIALHLINESHE